MSEPAPILLVEDSPDDVEFIVAALERDAGLKNEIVVARDGIEALDYLHQRGRFANRPPGAPVVVLLDLKLPRLDGHEVLERIRADPALSLQPVVLLTSSREIPDILRGYEGGANAYVVKPVPFDEFVNAVKQLGLFWVLTNEPPAKT